MYYFKQNKFHNDDDILKLNDNIICRQEITKYLTDFQFEAIRFLYKNFQNHQSCIFNDESGLGKTATVCTFLDTVLPTDHNKKILILVKNEKRILNWQFHLSMFVRKDFSSGISIKEWDSLRESSFINIKYDCIIIDDRDDLISNKICLAYLLRNFEEKVSLIISSKDVTKNLKLFHSMLRLIGRLDESFVNFKHFEEKFLLPDLEGNAGDLHILENYFVRREKLMVLCRDYRLRRLSEQFENQLPLVDKKVYEYNLEKWKKSQLSNTSNVFTTVYNYTSSSVSRRLIQNYDIFSAIEEDEFNAEVSKLTNLARNNEYDSLPMSPLLFESDSEEKNVSSNKKIIAAISQENTKSKNKSNAFDKKEILNAKPETRSSKKIVPKNSSKIFTNSQVKTRGMERVTRSRAKKSKYILLDMDKSMERSDRVRKIQKKKKLEDQKDNKKNNGENDKVIQTKAINKINENGLSGIISNDSNYTLDIVYPTNSEVIVISPPNEEIIIISGSSISSDFFGNRNNKNKTNATYQKSPELFRSIDEFSITCAQRPLVNELNTDQNECGSSKGIKKSNKITNYLSQDLFSQPTIAEYPKTPKKNMIATANYEKSKKSKSSPKIRNKNLSTITSSNSTLTKWLKTNNSNKDIADAYKTVKRRQLNY